MLTINELNANAHIRHCQIDEVQYFSIIDVLAHLRNSNFKVAQSYYHVVKKRMKDNGVHFTVKSIKAYSRDGKHYQTDFVTYDSLLTLVENVRTNLQKEHYRIKVRQDDERLHFHPLIVSFFESNGWHTEYPFKLPSGGYIDIVATHQDHPSQGRLVIECKPCMPRRMLYTALGQVLCYRAEYDVNAIPVIATYRSEATSYVQASCMALGVRLITADSLENIAIHYNKQFGYDYVGK